MPMISDMFELKLTSIWSEIQISYLENLIYICIFIKYEYKLLPNMLNMYNKYTVKYKHCLPFTTSAYFPCHLTTI